MNRFAQTRPQMTLGQLIDRLEALPDKEMRVIFDFPNAWPGRLDSYRGSYAELALEPDDYRETPHSGKREFPTVETLLSALREAVGKTYQGYKGGDFTMKRETPIWVSYWGSTSETAIVDVLPKEYQVILMTEYCEF